MALSLILLGLLLVGLGFFQAWTVWLLKREVARLEQRLDESLDDQDLLDFQERLQDLLKQARSTGAEMVETVARRQDALEKTLVLVKDAEAKLVARAQVLTQSAEALAQRTEKLQQAPAGKPAKKAVPKPKPVDAAVPPPAEAPEAQEEKERSYLVRPAPVTAPTPAPAPSPAPSRHQKVYDLADQGLNRDQIAKESGILAGEVELILNLRPKRPGRG
jgi:hypothetical protein